MSSIALPLRALRASPASLVALATVALFVASATSHNGYPVTSWAPAALVVLALVLTVAALVPLRVADVPVAVRVAVACLAAYTAWSYASIAWAGDRGAAWDGANRTLLYLLVFALFAVWRQRPRGAAYVLGAWTLAMIVLAAVTAVRVAAGDQSSFFLGTRLYQPAGYVNAAAATWTMAVWPALALAATPRVQWALRGVFAGGIVVLVDLALLSQSRGALLATALVLVLFFAVLPGRARAFAVLVPVGLAIAATAPLVLRVGDRLSAGANAGGALGTAVGAMLAGALVVGALVAAVAARASRRAQPPERAARIQRTIGRIGLATAALIVVGGLVAAGDPAARARSAWNSFNGGYASNSGGNRLVSGLGSNRNDFYRVAFDSFTAHPLAGIGADNFFQDYLAHGHSAETPAYPHSVELRTLAQTGVIGVLLLGGALVAALVAALGAAHQLEPLARAVACGAVAAFGYWLVHGSVDWFWEIAGLGAPAFALLGLACALAPRRPERQAGLRPLLADRRLALGCGVVAVAAAASLAAPWLSQRYIDSAAAIWPSRPGDAYARLDRAAALDPLSDQAYVVAGSIALRFGDLARADRDFAKALERTPRDSYATLERAAIASTRGQAALALRLFERAARLAPRDPLTAAALATARRGGRVDVRALNLSILRNGKQFTR